MTDQPPAPGPLEEALARVGDRWSLLVVDALLEGPRRFNELSQDLPGIASNVLSQRLRHLEAERIVVARPYSGRPVRFAYELSAEGRQLAGALRLLTQWGLDHGAGAHEPAAPEHEACGSVLEVRWYCPTCDRAVEEDEPATLRFL
ncbi:MAG TPA: helix-turn-helix domain-containing protein [Acidimicrobiales bacterium]|nr:helix-turn-helix domain-containing protein [Acidimicrobiales bacterium]